MFMTPGSRARPRFAAQRLRGGPAPLSSSAPLAYHFLNIINNVTSTAAGYDDRGIFNKNIAGVRINFSANSATTVQEGLLVAGRLTAANAGDAMGLNASMYSNIASTGAIYGVVGNAQIDAGGSGSRVLGAEFDVAITTGGSAPYRIGMNVTSYGNVAGSTLDSGIVISANPLQAPGIGFSKGITLSNIYGVSPIATTGDVFYVDSAQTVANVFNASNLTVTGNIFTFPNFSIANTNNQNATTQINLTNTSVGAGASVQSQYTNATNSLTVGIGGTALTGAYQGAGFITANGTAPLIVGTSGNAVVQFFANNAEKARINTSGQFAIGSTNPQTLLTVSANATATPSVAPLTGANIWVVGKDGAFNNGLVLDQYGGQANNPAEVALRQARGTAAAPTASALNDTLGQLRFFGYGTSFYRTAALFVTANETFSGTAGGGDLSWYLTPNTTQALAQAITFRASGGLTIGAISTDPGAGSIVFNAQLYGPNIATTASAANAFIDTATTPAGQLKRSTSSLVYKRDIEALDPAIALSVLRGAKPIWYRSKCAADNQIWSFYGLGAEDMAALDPRLVHYGYQHDDYDRVEISETRDGETIRRSERRLKPDARVKPDGVQYERLVPHLIAGWQAHEARIVALETVRPAAH